MQDDLAWYREQANILSVVAVKACGWRLCGEVTGRENINKLSFMFAPWSRAPDITIVV